MIHLEEFYIANIYKINIKNIAKADIGNFFVNFYIDHYSALIIENICKTA